MEEQINNLTSFTEEGDAMRKITRNANRWVVLLAGFMMVLLAMPAMTEAQAMISARAGLINVIDGSAEIHNSRDMRWERAHSLMQMGEGDELKAGRNSWVEVLLNPGSFARLGPGCVLHLVNGRLTAMSLELRAGSMEIEAANLKMVRRMRIAVLGRQFTVLKDGIYRFDITDSGTAMARTFRGEMLVAKDNGKTAKVKKSHEVDIDTAGGVLAFGRFNPKFLDQLSAWSANRDAFLARANYRMSAGYYSSFLPTGYFGAYPCGFGSWFYNSFFGGYTYLPGCGFDYGYFSPYGYYYPVVVVNRGGGVYRAQNTTRAHEGLISGFGRGEFKGPGRSFSNSGPGVSSAPPPASVGRSEMGGGGGREVIRH